MSELYYLLPLAGAISGLLTSLTSLILIQLFVTQKEIAPLLDQQLDELVLTFQQEIPMAGMFLKGKMVETLKNKAQEKLLAVIPKVKLKILKKIALIWLLAATTLGFFVGLLLNLLAI